jgi:hypothetical protein
MMLLPQRITSSVNTQRGVRKNDACTCLQYLSVPAIEATPFEAALPRLAGLDVLRACQQVRFNHYLELIRLNLLDRLVDDVPHNGHRLLLPQSHYSTDSLFLNRRVPLWLQNVHPIGDRQIVQPNNGWLVPIRPASIMAYPSAPVPRVIRRTLASWSV